MFSTAKIIDCSRLTQINNILLESFNNMFIINFELYLKIIRDAAKTVRNIPKNCDCGKKPMTVTLHPELKNQKIYL